MEYRVLWFVSTCNNDFEASSTLLMSNAEWANVFPQADRRALWLILPNLVVCIILRTKLYNLLCSDSCLKLSHYHVKFILLFFHPVSLLAPFVLIVYCTCHTCISLYRVYYVFEDCTYTTFNCVYHLFSLSIIFRSHVLPTCTN